MLRLLRRPQQDLPKLAPRRPSRCIPVHWMSPVTVRHRVPSLPHSAESRTPVLVVVLCPRPSRFLQQDNALAVQRGSLAARQLDRRIPVRGRKARLHPCVACYPFTTLQTAWQHTIAAGLSCQVSARIWPTRAALAPIPFSILKRIEGSETALSFPRPHQYFSLSASSNGSKVLGRGPAMSERAAVITLSASSNGSKVLRHATDATDKRGGVLSASSNGSKVLRLSIQGATISDIPAFSILKRIEGSETHRSRTGSARTAQLSASSNGSKVLRLRLASSSR
jgi:hypothetical protein